MAARQVVPPEGGRIHKVSVPVNLGREWQESIDSAGPGTPADYDVRKVGGQYPPTGEGIVMPELILMNFGLSGGSWDRAIAWSRKNYLEQIDPRHAFAISEHIPLLHQEFGTNRIYIIATKKCVFEGVRYFCGTCWQECVLFAVDACGSFYDWFVFSSD